MTRGLPLFLLVAALATVPLYVRPLGVVAVLALVLILLAAEPGEDAHATKGKGS